MCPCDEAFSPMWRRKPLSVTKPSQYRSTFQKVLEKHNTETVFGEKKKRNMSYVRLRLVWPPNSLRLVYFQSIWQVYSIDLELDNKNKNIRIRIRITIRIRIRIRRSLPGFFQGDFLWGMQKLSTNLQNLRTMARFVFLYTEVQESVFSQWPQIAWETQEALSKMKATQGKHPRDQGGAWFHWFCL